jgi:hypothetical protein
MKKLGILLAIVALLSVAAVNTGVPYSANLRNWGGVSTNLVVYQGGYGTNINIQGTLSAQYVVVDNILESRVLGLNSGGSLTNTDLTIQEASRQAGTPSAITLDGTNAPIDFSRPILQTLSATSDVGFYFTNAPSGNYTEASIELLVTASGGAREVWFPSPWVCYSTNAGAAVSVGSGKNAIIALSYKGTNVHYAIALQTN